MAIANISAFKSQLQGGARPNQFSVEVSFPSGVANVWTAVAPLQASFLVHAASIPPSSVAPANAPYRGRDVYLAGERTFPPWTISVYNTETFSLRNAFESWSEAINSNTDNTGITAPSQYQADLAVVQYDRNNLALKSYKFVDAFPLDVGPIELEYSKNNVVESFQVTFAYQYWVSNTTGSSGVGIALSTPLGILTI
ncbi:MAG: phage tail protein [Bacilli bacterium]|nr:phage tail protein [Bacilli bacterium]